MDYDYSDSIVYPDISLSDDSDFQDILLEISSDDNESLNDEYLVSFNFLINYVVI